MTALRGLVDSQGLQLFGTAEVSFHVEAGPLDGQVSMGQITRCRSLLSCYFNNVREKLEEM